MKKLPPYISIKIETEDSEIHREVYTADYVRAKVKQLREFGYKGLQADAVEKQLKLLLAGKKWTDIIGGFMEKDEPKLSKGA